MEQISSSTSFKSGSNILSDETSAESFLRVQELRALSECISSQVLNKMNENQVLCMSSNYIQESSEVLVRKSLQDRISEVDSWRAIFYDLSKRIEEHINLLNREVATMRVVIQRVDAEIYNHVLGEGRPNTFNPVNRDPVELELDKEMKLLKNQRTKLLKKISEADQNIVQFESAKLALDREIQVKGHGIRIDSQVMEMGSHGASARTPSNRKKKSKSHQTWINDCEKLKSQGDQALRSAMEMRELLRGMRVELSCAVHAQSTVVDTALRRRIHYNRNQMHELQWQKEEVRRDMQNLDAEEFLTEKTLNSSLAQLKLVESRLAGRAGKAESELICDDAEVQLRQESARLKGSIKDMRCNINRIRALRHSLSTALGDIDCCVEDREQTLLLDEQRMRRRATPGHSKCDAASASDDTSPRTQSEQRPLSAIQECEEGD